MNCVCGSDHRYCGGDHASAMSERAARELRDAIENATCAQYKFNDEHECTYRLEPAECSQCYRIVAGVFTCDQENNMASLCTKCERGIRAEVDYARTQRID